MAKETTTGQVDPTGTTPEQLEKMLAQLRAELKEQVAKHDFQQKRADQAEVQVKTLQKSSVGRTPPATEKSVVFGGVTHDVIGTFRADNTFVEVKRGACPEGVTLIAIGKPH